MQTVLVKPILLPKTFDYQDEILNDASRFKVICAGRRAGKSVMALIACLDGHGETLADGTKQYKGAVDGGQIWWVAPNYRQASIIWRLLKKATKDAWLDKNETDRRIDLHTGGSVTIRSAHDPDTLRGDGLDGLVIDEAAFIADGVFTTQLRPALADKQGWCMFISTPDGENWFYELFESAPTRNNYARWQFPTDKNPKIPSSELEEARIDMGSIRYAQEHGAEFVTIGNSLFKVSDFRYYDQYEHSTQAYILHTDNGRKNVKASDCYRIQTIDLAASTKTTADYTVISTWDITPDKDLILVDVLRNRFEGSEHLQLMQDQYLRYKPDKIKVEATGFQLSTVQIAIKAGLPVVKADGADKDKVARAIPASARIEAHTVYFPTLADYMDVCEKELRNFPNAAHDDFVDTLSYAALEIALPKARPRARQL